MDKSKITIATDSAELHFSWNEPDYEWSSIQYFYSWSGFNCENRLPELEDGQIYLNIETSPGEKPSERHVRALTWLLAQPDAANQMILNALYKKYPDIKNNASAFFDSDTLNLLYPSIDKINDLKNLISLSRIKIYEESKNELPYLGFDFESNWDAEHGIQVLINGPRIVNIGSDALNPNNIYMDGGEI